MPHEPDRIVSPFANVEAPSPAQHSSVGAARRVRWLLAGSILLLILAGVSLWAFTYLSDPFRTLEPFPVAKYLDSPRAMTGAKFKGELKVEADLGWKDGAGRLMLFSTAEDPRVIAVLVAPNLAQTYFTKGQNYLAELEVREGGLVFASNVKKK